MVLEARDSTKNNKNTRGVIFISIFLELVLLNLCIQCLTEFLKMRNCFKIVG